MTTSNDVTYLINVDIFLVNGYFKDDKMLFDNYIFIENDNIPDGMNEEDIFFFGQSEQDLLKLIEIGETTRLDFVITSFIKTRL